jgi:hypothetical protein
MRLAQRRSFLAGHRRTARHARGCVDALDRVMRRSATHSHSAFHVHVQLLARLAAGVIRHTERRDVQWAAGPQLPVQVRPAWLRMPAVRHELFQHLAERLVESRTVPGAAAAAPRLAIVTRVEQRQAAPRIETVMLRSQPPGAKASAAPAGDAHVTAASPRPGSMRAPPTQQPAPLVLPAQEMSRLTEHVIRQLDHRVLSWQERTGRA